MRRFGGNKFPLLVRAGRRVTVQVDRASRGRLSHGHAKRRKVSFRSCSPNKAWSKADGEPVTFWSGFVLVPEPACVRLKVLTDRRDLGALTSSWASPAAGGT